MDNHIPWWEGKVGMAFSVADWRTIYTSLGALAANYRLWEEQQEIIEDIEDIRSQIEKYALKS